MSAAKTETRPKEDGEVERTTADGVAAPVPVVTDTPPSGAALGRTTSEESAGSQGSGGRPQAQKPRGEQAAGSRRGRDRSISAGSSTDQQDLPADPKPAEGRKRLQLKPRSKPLDAPVETTAARSAAIFGGGRPHDDLEYEKKRLEREAKNPSASGGAAATVAATVTPDKPITRERSNSGSWGHKKNDAPRPYSSAYVPAHKTPGSGGKHHGSQQPPQPLYPGDPGYNEAVAAKAGAPYFKKGLVANVSANKEVKKPQKSKKAEADDDWQEVDAHAAKLAAKHAKQEEEEELQLAQAHKVRNAFAALNLEDEEEEGIEA